MGKDKLKRFEELKTFDRVFQYPRNLAEQAPDLKGKWNKDVFHRDAPIIIEAGCGRGEYTIGLAKGDTSKNYIGVDIKGARLWRGAKTGHEEQLHHVAFLRTSIEILPAFFGEGELSEIWITFPDPQPGLNREKRRLTHPDHLQMYRKLLAKDGVIHLKTDSSMLYEYTLEILPSVKGDVLYKSNDLYHDKPEGFNLDIKTTYEMKFLARGMKINYLKFRFGE